MDVLKLAAMFELGSAPVSYKENRTGHINSTYFITTESGKRFVLQRINTYVFKDPEGLMNNAVLVTTHIRKKTREASGDTERCTLEFIPVKSDSAEKSYCLTVDGEAYRVYSMIENAVSRQAAESPEELADVGYAFGHFQMQLADFDASLLSETIPDFHNTASRYRNFEKSLAADVCGRAASVSNEIDFVRKHADICPYIVNKIKDGVIPLRVTHNDTKLNNILLDENTKKPVCVIDLDTVMPGSVLYDFGDAIRFGAATAAEDETDLSLVGADLSLFEAFTRGFIEGLEGSLTAEELSMLPLGAIVITLETGIRFLTDYLDGDKYFRVSHPGHNLERARNQFAMVADLEKKLGEMNEIVKKYSE
ncbi:MAG: aminoglycoside phosphotransferase family protein [Clostridia bacterium]|nr:aminoglycoside phosphotransferase family protein [Clostridia bacterium]